MKPCRDQLQMRSVDLDSLLAADHPARTVWAFVDGLDLSALHAQIKAAGDRPGRPAIDPRILLALWLTATLDGIGSARALDCLCVEHDVYRWICGGVAVNYHTLADFRVQKGDFLDQLLTSSVAALLMQGAVTLNRVAQDGVRVRASAGSGSFRRRKRLKEFLKLAEEQVSLLRTEIQSDPAAASKRQQAARERAVRERKERITNALAEMKQIESQYAAKNEHGNKRKKPPADSPPGDAGSPPQDKREARASSTDPQARRMKGADGGFRPSYNVQFATDTASGVIVGLDVINRGADWDELPPMLTQLHQRYGRYPGQALVDGGFSRFDSVIAAENLGSEVYAPVPSPSNAKLEPHQPRPMEPPELTRWRLRMATQEAKDIYRQRAGCAEWVNALARNRGLKQFVVRGLVKTRAIVCWYALAHNVMRLAHLTPQVQPA